LPEVAADFGERIVRSAPRNPSATGAIVQATDDGWEWQPEKTVAASPKLSSAVESKPSNNPKATSHDNPYQIDGVAAGLAWGVALLLVVIWSIRSRDSWWAERHISFASCGLIAAGLGTIAGYFFLALIGWAVLTRLVWAFRRFLRLALR
jgi:hypothetical protein